jgi:hypothetical protein
LKSPDKAKFPNVLHFGRTLCQEGYPLNILEWIRPLQLAKQVLCAIDDAVAGKFDAALLHACFAIDGVSKRIFPNSTKVGVRYANTLRRYYWILEPMMGAGINLEDSKFTNIVLRNNTSPDFADIVYEILRCSHAHCDEVPENFSVLPSAGPFYSEWQFGLGELHMPDRVIWALLAVAVLSYVSKGQATTGTYYLSLGDEKFPLKEWWGREDDFRPIAAKYNKTRVKFDGLDRLQSPKGDGSDQCDVVNIINPPFL